MNKISILLLLLFCTSSANALISCGSVPVKRLTIEADRENGSVWANTVSIDVSGGACGSSTTAYLKNDHPAYNSIVSTLLSVHARGGLIKVVVKSAQGISANAKEIEYVVLH